MVNSNRKKIIVIVGPTASGKSDLAIRIARKYAGEIISADSRQVYRGMDIGTGKVRRDRTLPKFKVQSLKFKVFLKKNFYSEGVRHYLLDIVSPKKQFTADDFKKLGEKIIEEISSKNKIPIIAGGTGFYIDILLGRMSPAEVPANPRLRAKLENQSAEQLFKRLARLDPGRAKIIDRHNKRRLIRALEIRLATKKSSLNTRYGIQDTKYKILWLGINPGKEILAQKIKKRLDSRLNQGMIKEVQDLHRKGVSWKRLDNFGLEYRWLSRYLKQFTNKPSSKDFKKSEYYKDLLSDIVIYSKRQMTWFKKNREVRWVTKRKDAERFTKRFLRS